MFTDLHMKYVFFLYGLSFFMLGFAILIYPKQNSAFSLARHLNLIAGFGLIHGANEWLDLLILMHRPASTFVLELLQAVTLPVSFIFLLLFGVQKIEASPRQPSWLRSCPWGLLALWTIVVLFSSDRLQSGDIAARYLLGFPGTVLTSIALYRHLAALRETGLNAVIKHLKFMIVVFSIYGLLAGFIVKASPFFPANLLNYDWVIGTFGIPVQVFRALCAACLAYSTLRVLSVFHWETQQQVRGAESEIANYRSELSRTRRLTELGMMSKILADKLRKPLSVSQVLLQRLAMEDDKPKGRSDTVEQCLGQLKEAVSVVKRFCDHVDMPAMAQNAAIDLQDVLSRIIAAFKERAEAADLTISLDTCPSQARLMIAHKELQYIVSTLIEHILDRANRDTAQTLRIQCQQDTDQFLIQFKDTCRGLSAEDIEHAFVPFALNTSRAGHNDIGLAVVKQIVQENEGSISVNSQEGKGTTFCLRLPTYTDQEVTP
ncbi:MAG: HAMP domain-containing histidine kinase [Phycisphaerae bacterium]|nr:HAMP domain-containing histidine kinase [Phycisphaerae bacterium]